jgi:hypothetical protein
MDKKRRGCSVRQMSAGMQVQIQLANSIATQRDEARLMKLRGSDKYRVLYGVIVTEYETYKLTAAQPGRIKQHNGETKHLRA